MPIIVIIIIIITIIIMLMWKFRIYAAYRLDSQGSIPVKGKRVFSFA
jgi:uncharacterized membrane protein